MFVDYKTRQCASRVFLLALLVSCYTTAHAGFSGDLQIDAFMGTGYKVRAGGSGGEIYRNDPIKCNSPGADVSSTGQPLEATCPNDATYTPSAGTGGYQAWGVGVAHINLEVEDVDCYLTFEVVFNWWTGDWQTGLVYVCEVTEITFPLGSFGRAMARVRWGFDELGTDAYWPPPAQYGPPTSLSAFYDNELADCEPFFNDPTNGELNPNRINALCENTVDSSFVAEPGYEIDITMTDPLCRAGLFGRTNTDLDRDANCFYYHHWSQESTLPSDYKDTVLFDDQIEFTIGFGSAAADFIVPGFTYEVSQHFQSRAQPTMTDHTAVHTGSITADICELSIFVNFIFDNLCHFSVDVASVGGPPDRFDNVTIPANW